MGTSRAGLLDRAKCQRLLRYADYSAVASCHGLHVGYGRAAAMRRLLGPTVHDSLPCGAGKQCKKCHQVVHMFSSPSPVCSSVPNPGPLLILSTWPQVDLDLKDRDRIPGYYEQDKQVLKAYQVRIGIFD